LAVTAFVSMLVLVGFIIGWTLRPQQSMLSTERSSDPPRQKVSQAARPTMPAEDVPGEDLSELPRYPGSIRVEHLNEDLGGIVATEVEYLTLANLDSVRKFYRDVFRTEDWNVTDVGFSEGAWEFYVIKSEREVFVKIEPYGDLVEIDLELTEPKPERETDPERPEAEEQETPAPPSDPDPAPPTPAPDPAPTSSATATASPAPAPASPSPAPAPAYDDDDGPEGFDDDDGYGGDGDD